MGALGDGDDDSSSWGDGSSAAGLTAKHQQTRVSFVAFQGEDGKGLLSYPASSAFEESAKRKVSVVTLPPKKSSFAAAGRGGRRCSARWVRRSRSEPPLLPSRAMALIMGMSVKRR